MSDPARRRFLKTAVAVGGAAALATGRPNSAPADLLSQLLQNHFQRLEPAQIAEVLSRIERQAQRDYGVAIRCESTPALPGVRFGFALNLSKCIGCRRCVEACVLENNCGVQGNLQNIRVVALPSGGLDLSKGNHYYPGPIPVEGKWYLPVQCHQCENPPCVQACPVEATWREPDGIVVIDYDWCIGCRYCAVACPYWARHFNWAKPEIPAEAVNPQTHYLGNRPRPRGVMEKCTFCIQRTRKGRLPVCQEACPTGARIFGDLADPGSEIRFVLANRPVFRLKEFLHTNPRFWYFTDSSS